MKKDKKIGMICAIICALVWGVLPVYWKSLQPINSFLIMFYRLVLVCLLVFIIDIIIYGWKRIIEPFKDKKTVFTFFVAGLVISINWSLYIWMVNSGLIIQTSIGYYIEPLMVCVFGLIIFKEKMARYQVIAFVFACIGVVIMLVSYGQIPVLALALATCFAIYAAIKKKLQAPALLALFYETVFLVPVVVPIILYMEINGQGALAVGNMNKFILLLFSGLFTAIPLSLFGMAANRISLFALGITEYISPSMGLIIGIFVYKEHFDIYQFIGFIFIWIGLFIFSSGMRSMVKESDEDNIPMEENGNRVEEKG